MILIQAKSISEAHEKVMRELIWNHIDVFDDETQTLTWEICPVSIDISNPLNDMIHRKSSFQKARCDAYAQQLIQGVMTDQTPAEKFSYTYHERLFLEHQYEDVLYRLKNRATRRAVLYTWLPVIDNRSDEVPCLQSIQFVIRKKVLNGVVSMRSNDMLSAFGPNAYGFVRLLELTAQKLGLKVGTYTHIAICPHLYPVRDKTDLVRWY